MTHHEIAKKAILICSMYGLLSILQTLNSRFLYKALQFDYYSFVLLHNSIDLRSSKVNQYFSLLWHRNSQILNAESRPYASLRRIYVPFKRYFFLLPNCYALSWLHGFQEASYCVRFRCFFGVEIPRETYSYSVHLHVRNCCGWCNGGRKGDFDGLDFGIYCLHGI